MRVFFFLLITGLGLAGCTRQLNIAALLRTENRILSFEINNQNGIINEDDRTISIELMDADVTLLSPTITISEGAVVTPASNVTQDFTTPITYVVMAENGDVREYMVRVN